MLVTKLGMVTDVKAEQLANAIKPMLLTELPKVIDDKLLQLANA
jgi:hypothetical protein